MFRMKPSKKSRWDFSAETSALRARFVGNADKPQLVRIEVFFTPGDPEQKTDLKSPLRGQTTIFSTKLDGTEMFRLWF